MSRATEIDVSILLVSYNTRALTCAALDSVRRETHEVRYEIIAIDNASSDGSAEAIADHPSRPRCMALESNIGFARANNLAAAGARGSYLLLLNPDTEVRNGAIDTLVRFARSRPEALIWGGRTVFADGTLNPSSCWARMTPWNLLCRATGLTGLLPGTELFNGEAYGGWDRDSVRKVDIVSGCFFLVERELWEELGGFDPSFFMYGEETDFCLRARALGARPVITPEATILHHGGASEATRAGKMIKLLAAKVTLVRRHWSPALVSAGVALLALWPLSRWLSLAAAAAVTSRAPLREMAAA
jgi:GT2 family glycosyltransferase